MLQNEHSNKAESAGRTRRVSTASRKRTHSLCSRNNNVYRAIVCTKKSIRASSGGNVRCLIFDGWFWQSWTFFVQLSNNDYYLIPAAYHAGLDVRHPRWNQPPNPNLESKAKNFTLGLQRSLPFEVVEPAATTSLKRGFTYRIQNTEHKIQNMEYRTRKMLDLLP